MSRQVISSSNIKSIDCNPKEMILGFVFSVVLGLAKDIIKGV